MKKTWTIHSLEELDDFAQQLVLFLSPPRTEDQATIVTLRGNLGAGKTTLTQHIGECLDINEEMSSPTFVIAKYYELKSRKQKLETPWQRLIHIDAYRLEGEPLEPLGFDELFADPTNLIIVEWPEYIESILPATHTPITITRQEDETRTIEIK